MRVVFTGDVFLGGEAHCLDMTTAIGIDSFNNADVKIVNLEAPICLDSNKFVAEKSVLYSSDYAVRQLLQLNVTAVNLAHNHLQDKGDQGILDTIETLRQAGIGVFGAGKNYAEARQPFKISDDLFVLGYCQYASPTLNMIQLAEKNRPGVNALNESNILEDLKELPDGARAILYFHWGREHVWLTQFKNLELAKKLLKHEQVEGIIGMHPHRAQGYLSSGSKRAYFSLGNFLFPNFYIKPSTQIHNPTTEELNSISGIATTRQYHRVNRLTFKKWRFVNRVSQIIIYDTSAKSLKHEFAYQSDDQPVISSLQGTMLLIFKLWCSYISLLYKMPKPLYILFERTFSFVRSKTWNLQVKLFYLRENGLKWVINKAINRNYAK